MDSSLSIEAQVHHSDFPKMSMGGRDCSKYGLLCLPFTIKVFIKSISNKQVISGIKNAVSYKYLFKNPLNPFVS